MNVIPLRVPSQHNPLYCKPHQLENPSAQGERVQYEKKEFTDWINSYLQQIAHYPRVLDLQEDLADGITLLCFVQQISFEAPPCIHQKPALYVHRLENTKACLSFLDRLGVDLSAVHAEDVARGDIKTILALCRAMYIRFEGDMTEDHRCLSPVLSWKHKSPSSSLSASMSSTGFTWPQYPWKPEEETSPHGCCGASPGDMVETREEGRPYSSFTVWYKEDMAVFSWIQRLLGQELKDYSELDDGILLCAVVNQLWDGSITQEEVLYSTPLERLEIATEAAEQFLGVPRTELDLRAVITGQGREVLPWYLLELKAASEQMFREYIAMEAEKERTKNEEEMVNRMRRHLIRQHSRQTAEAPPTANPATTRHVAEKPPHATKGWPPIHKDTRKDVELKRSLPKVPLHFPQGTDVTEQKALCVPSPNPRQDRIREVSRKPKQTQKDTLGTDLKSPKKAPAVSFAAHSSRNPDTSNSSEYAQDEMLETVEQLETSLSSLMQPETVISPGNDPRPLDQRDRDLTNEAPPVPWNSYPSPPTPSTSSRSQTSSSAKQLSQPDVSSFFSPFSMPFVSLRGRRDSVPQFRNAVRNSSSSVVEDDSLARGKLTSWSDKDVRKSPGKDVPMEEPALPQKSLPRKLSATMLARLAARSPAGLASMSSSDSDE